MRGVLSVYIGYLKFMSSFISHFYAGNWPMLDAGFWILDANRN